MTSELTDKRMKVDLNAFKKCKEGKQKDKQTFEYESFVPLSITVPMSRAQFGLLLFHLICVGKGSYVSTRLHTGRFCIDTLLTYLGLLGAILEIARLCEGPLFLEHT